jgi:MoaA/NifB/PqqE/SkfB family radical SAM enzyme
MCGVQCVKIAMLSGCRYNDCGGAQRPPGLARAFVRLGHEVLYHNRLDTIARTVHDVKLVHARDIENVDACLCCLSEYAPIADRLRRQGALVVYDLLDDWDNFVSVGSLKASELRWEQELIRIASAVTCSAPALVARASRLGARRTELILNAGPEHCVETTAREYDWVYSGYLFGPWLDWSLFEVLDASGMRGLVIGHYENLPQWRHIDAVGELPHAEALDAMARARVGVIPFKGALCRSVDPIKYYDYMTAGLWTVATPDVEPLAGRPWVRMAAPERFAEAVDECSQEVLRGNAPGPEALDGNRWSDRAEQFIELLSRLTPVDGPPITQTPSPKRIRWNGMRLNDEDCRLRVTWMAPMTCNMQPPCPYCSNEWTRRGKPALGAEPDALLEGFLRLSECYGPLYISVCYGEPMSDDETIDIIAELAKTNRIDLVSNLVAPIEQWRRLAGRPNIAVAASYHPHHWSVDEFLRKRRQIEACGIRMGIVSVVAYPPDDEARVDAIVKDLAHRHICAHKLPYWGAYNGRVYPIQNENVLPEQKSSAGILCRTGKDYIAIDAGGIAYRCYMMGPPIGSILEENVALASDATPCDYQCCPCQDMQQFWVREG